MAELRLWQNLTTRDFEALDPDRTVALQPVGAIEQHGPHLPVATDAAIAEAVAHAAARRVGAAATVLVLPTQAVGKSNEHIDFPGTLTLDAETLRRLWFEIGASVARAGVRKIAYLNAHGGQPQVMEIVCRDLRVEHRMLAAATSWWMAGLPEGLIPAEERAYGIHGGTVETALMLHLRPEAVRMDQARDFRPLMRDVDARYQRLRMIGPMQLGWQAQDIHPDGVAGNAAAATAEIGAAIFEHVTAGYAALLDEIADYPLANLRDRG